MKKTILWGALIVAVIAGPMVAVSTPFLKKLEEIAISRKDKSWAPGLLMFVGDVYLWTMREPNAIEPFRFVAEYLPKYERRGDAMYYLALAMRESLNSADRVCTVPQVMTAYENFLRAYPSHEKADTAKQILHRMKQGQ